MHMLAHSPARPLAFVRIPLALRVRIRRVDRITARFETDSSKHVEDIVAALKTEKCFREVKEGKLEKNKDGTTTVHFGGDPKAANSLRIMPGWNYTVRLYRPRAEILDGTWKFPEPTAAK